MRLSLIAVYCEASLRRSDEGGREVGCHEYCLANLDIQSRAFERVTEKVCLELKPIAAYVISVSGINLNRVAIFQEFNEGRQSLRLCAVQLY